ncbi:MAG: RNA polymerase sigma factor [Lewinella sp.]|jgi:RNA polymerase sigma-70 factor (ECF subfamily)|uniref:RNA polymerase sigma factor n=1 Tax=Lewinella sp. TaxID=2004506 RepID=UPI003D6B102C
MLRFLRTQKEDTSDAELLTRFQQKEDRQALAVLFDRYIELIYGLSLQYLKTPSRAEDATLAIYAELQQKLPHHEVKNFKNWLYTFIRNHCLMQLRKEKKMITVNYDPAFMQSDANWHLSDGPSEEEERESALDFCLEQLNDQQKACVQLFYYKGHSYKEIATMRNEDVGRIRSNIQNGRRNLKNCIEGQEQRNE